MQLTFTDSILLWAIAIVLLYLGVQAAGSGGDLGHFVHEANRWLVHLREDLDLPSASQIYDDADSLFDGLIKSGGTFLDGAKG
jgi:hypothetical protein